MLHGTFNSLADFSVVYITTGINTHLQGVKVLYLGGHFKILKCQNEVDTFTICAKTYLANVCEKIERLIEVVLKSVKLLWPLEIIWKWMTLGY